MVSVSWYYDDDNDGEDSAVIAIQNFGSYFKLNGMPASINQRRHRAEVSRERRHSGNNNNNNRSIISFLDDGYLEDGNFSLSSLDDKGDKSRVQKKMFRNNFVAFRARLPNSRRSRWVIFFIFVWIVWMLVNVPSIMFSQDSARRQLRYDDAGVKYLTTDNVNGKMRGTIYALPSIQHRHYPQNEVYNVSYFIEQRKFMTADGIGASKKKYIGENKEKVLENQKNSMHLFEYNHMLFPLYSKHYRLSNTLLNQITGRYDCNCTNETSKDQPNNAFTKDECDAVRYVAVFRVSNHAHCFGDLGMKSPDVFQNYLGMALLDKNLTIIEGSDVVMDINQAFKSKRMDNQLQDCQLLSAPTHYSQDHEKMFLLCNSYLTPVLLRRRKPEVQSKLTSNKHTVKNIFGNGLELSLIGDNLSGQEQKKNFLSLQLIPEAKNMHIFACKRQFYLEIWPSSPHIVREINLLFPSNSIDRVYQPFSETGVDIVSKVDSPLSFDPPDSHRALNFESKQPRGTACCIHMNWKNSHVLVGIAHERTASTAKVFLNQFEKASYLSQFYAFKPYPPFDLVMKSGYFCFGWAEIDDVGCDNQPFACEVENFEGSIENPTTKIFGDKFPLHNGLILVNEAYNCPKIQFATGIVEKSDDEDIVLISYSVNDCYPRTIQVSKDKILDMLAGK